MSLLAEIYKIGKKKAPKVRDHNFVAKHAQSSGAGVHADKNGPRAPRSKQKQEWKKEIHND